MFPHLTPNRLTAGAVLLVVLGATGAALYLAGGTLLLQLLVAGLGFFAACPALYHLLTLRPPHASSGRSPLHTSPVASVTNLICGTEADTARFEAIWEQSPLALVLLDPHDPDGVVRILDCNQTACELHGRTREEIIGQSIDILEASPWEPHWREGWLKSLRENRRVEGEGTHRRKDGTVFPTDYFTCLVTIDGREYVIGMDHDATQRKAVENELREAKENAEAADRAKSEFLAVMSHEIRTPMNGVIGFTSLLLDTPVSPEQRDWLSTIRSSGESLLTLINDILDFSKIESGRMELDHRPARLDRCIEECVGLMWSRANEKDIELLSWVDPAIPLWVLTDITRVRQVVLNLVGNAVKFTSRGEIEVRAEPLPDPGRRGKPASRIAITVRDTGVGIPADRLHRLFKPFSQADSSTTREFGGTGLGLAISRRLAELLDGTVELLESSPQGSTFRFTLSAPACSAPDGAEEPEFIDESAVDLRGKRALVVDDNLTNCRILQRLLSRWQMEPVTCARGSDALQAIAAADRPFDIILLDMMMPGMNGLELAARLRTECQSQPPLLLLSSVGQDELRQLGDISCFQSILHKPLRQSGLFDALIETLAQRRPEPDRQSEASKSDLRAFAAEHPLEILVAEDNKVNRKLIQQVLERHGYTPRLVSNGRECLEALRETPCDLVLMDCQMPIIDGYDATRQIRQGLAGDASRHVPIVALTAAAMTGDRERCLEAGMNDYLAKPVRTEDVVALLRSIDRRATRT